METTITWESLLSPKKTTINVRLVRFFGCLCDEFDVDPDKAKVAATKSMYLSKSLIRLQQFLGMVQYQNPFMPYL